VLVAAARPSSYCVHVPPRLLAPLPWILIVAAAGTVGAQPTAPLPPASGSSRNVQATLLSETSSIQPGRTLWMGLRLKTAPGWHVYWKQPGDAGVPPKLGWTLPAGFDAGAIVWPYPQRFDDGGLASYGYTGEVLLPIPVTVPSTAAPGMAHIVTKASWIECREICLGGRATLGLALPVKDVAPRPGAAAAMFRRARARVPLPSAGWTFEQTSERLVLRPPPGWAPPGTVEFFSAQDRVVSCAARQRVVKDAGGWGLELVRDAHAIARGGPAAPSVQGVLVARRGATVEALEIDAIPRAAAPGGAR
jgi:thiol:disulfide interchange protein DsbD